MQGTHMGLEHGASLVIKRNHYLRGAGTAACMHCGFAETIAHA